MTDIQTMDQSRTVKSEPIEAPKVVYRFGDFELEMEPHELTRDGEAIDLAPQPAKILELLAAADGEVVSREAIRECLWGVDSFIDHVKGINFVIHQIRTALGEQASCPVFIETVPREGYRFAAPVQAVDPSTSPPPQALKGYERPRLTRRLLPWVALGLFLTVLLETAFFVHAGWAGEDSGWLGGETAKTVPRLAILAAAESEAGQMEAVPIAATEALSAYLAESFGPNLEVMAPPPGIVTNKESVMDDAQYALSVASFGSETSPHLVIRLTRCHGHAILWTTTADASMRELPGLFDRVVDGVSTNLHITSARYSLEPRGEASQQASQALDRADSKTP